MQDDEKPTISWISGNEMVALDRLDKAKRKMRIANWRSNRKPILNMVGGCGCVVCEREFL